MDSKFVQRNAGLKSIPPTPSPAQLLELDLSGNLLILQLHAFQSFTRLRKLVLSATGLTALPLLPASLESIEIAGNQMQVLPSALRMCTSLAHLDVSRNQISSLVPLARLKELRTLIASDNRIALLTGLESLSKLTSLSLDNTKVKDTEQISRLSSSVQFLSLRNTPVLRFVSSVSQLPGNFVALQDGQLFGPEYEGNARPADVQRTRKVSVGFIDLRKMSPDGKRARSKTPDPAAVRQSQPVLLQEVVEEFNLLKAENAALEEKVTWLEGQLSGRDGDSSQFVLMELISELDIDVNEFSFSLNKRGQLLAILQERERERQYLRQQNAALTEQLKLMTAAPAPPVSTDMYLSDLESHLREMSDKVAALTTEGVSLQDKVARQSAKLAKFADFRERNRELARIHKQEMAKNRELQDHLSKVYSDYSKLLRAGLCSALESAPAVAKEEKQKEMISKQTSPQHLEETRKTDPRLLNRLEQRLAKLHSKVQKMTVRPDEYFQKLQLCHEMLDMHPLA